MAPQTLGMTLIARREATGLTQVELAKKAKLSQAYVASLESGYRTNPSLAILQRLAKALRVPVTALLG
ncbi:MAG TPA: helix-turn-helix transcriptional regulator [Thermoleophilaceae bacterium]|jgi:transcriptional regulator with XRE-family HTH domain